MILLDQTIVAVATPDLQTELGASLNQVVWVTSIYLLFFAVPLLVTGRLGDRYGQRNIYLIGMRVITHRGNPHHCPCYSGNRRVAHHPANHERH